MKHARPALYIPQAIIDSARMNRLRNGWEGFLPPGTLVMTSPSRSIAPSAQPTSEEIVAEEVVSAAASADSLERVAADLDNCQRCKLCSGRKTIVAGEGNPNAKLVFVGEGPGENEDIQGRPFVGKAGQLLDKMIEAIGLQRQDVYICNVVKCRPPDNRNPEPDELAACQPFLERQLAVIRPQIVVALGKFAAQTLLKTDEGITRIRGRFFDYHDGARLMPTFHPSYLLRTPEAKREAWADLQAVAKELGLSIPKRGGA